MSAPTASSPAVRDQHGQWQRETVYLLDVNVLIALLDPMHTHHQRAHAWFAGHVTAWSSCAVTQNGYVRIVSNPRYANAMSSPAEALALLRDVCARPDHRFWPADVSVLDAHAISGDRLLATSQITDSCLLALAVRHGGQLATFDKRLVTDAVQGGRAALHVIGD